MRPALVPLLLMCSAGPALAEDRDARAREELERAFREMVKLPPATVEVVFDGIDSTRYKLLEGSFALDDRPIPMPAGSNVVFAGEIQPGTHTLSTTLVYEAPSPVHGSIKYKVPGKFIFMAQRGVLMRVRAHIEVDDGAEPAKRLQLMGQSETTLRAKLEEPLPPPPEHKPAEWAAAASKQLTSPDASQPSSGVAPAIQPAVTRQKAAHRKPTSPVVEAAPEAQAALAVPAAEKPAEAAPPPEEHPSPSPAPVAVEQPAPPHPAPPPAPAPAPVSTQPEMLAQLLGYLNDFGTAIAGSAMALIGGLLLLAVVRKKR